MDEGPHVGRRSRFGALAVPKVKTGSHSLLAGRIRSAAAATLRREAKREYGRADGDLRPRTVGLVRRQHADVGESGIRVASQLVVNASLIDRRVEKNPAAAAVSKRQDIPN
jgi:hypothetical protein